MAATVVDWPTAAAFEPRRMQLGLTAPKSGWRAFFTGQAQSISHLADRLRLAVTLRPCNPDDAALREAFLMGVASRGDWLRLGLLHRPVPRGTLRGTPTAAATAAAGARTLQVQGVSGDTLLGGDALGHNGQLLMADYAGAVANGSGVLTVPLVLPLQAAISSGASLTWQAPATTWQIEVDQLDLSVGRARWQGEIEIAMKQVF